MGKSRDRKLEAAQQRLSNLKGMNNLRERMAVHQEITALKREEVQRILDQPRRK